MYNCCVTKHIHFPLIFLLFIVFSPLSSLAQDIDFSDTIPLKENDQLLGFDALDPVVPGNKVFIVGENHTYLESNSALWVQNIKYLHKHAGVRNVLLESGRSMSWLANTYIQTGDSALFDVIKKYVFEEYANRYKMLREFNATLDSNEKVSIIGVDLERGGYGALKVLSLLIPDDGKPHDSIDLHIESIQGMAMYQDKEIFKDDEEDRFGYTYSVRNTIDLVIENFGEHELKYKDLLGENFGVFKDILTGLKETGQWREMNYNNSVQGYVFREKYMFQRFKEEFGSRQGGFYGQFGRCHASKKQAEKNGCDWYMFKSFANRIKQSDELNLTNRVMTMGILYESDENFEDEEWDDAESHIEMLFNQLDDDRLLLYNLNQDSFLRTFFKDDFDFVFLNSKKPDEEHPYYDGDDDDDFDLGQRFYLTYSLGNHLIDFDALSLLHPAAVRESFTNGLVSHNVDFVTSNDEIGGFMTGSNFGVYQAIETNNVDSMGESRSRLTGFTYNSYFLYNVLPEVKFIDLFAGASIGYSLMNLTVSESSPNTNQPITTGFIGGEKASVFKNPAITGRIMAGLNLNLGNITLGGDVGISQDFSKTNWRLAGELLNQGPKTSFNGLIGHVRLGFNFGV